jgi:hypothetical protein
MESTTFNTNRLLWIVAATGVCIGLAAFQQKQQKPPAIRIPQTTNQDTIPKKKERKVRNLDEALEELDRANVEINIEKLNVELAEIGPQVEKEIRNAKIEVEKALKEVDMEKINEEINASLKDIDWKEIKEEVDASVSKIDWKKIKKELEDVKEINLEKMDIDMKKVHEELERIKPELEKNLKEAKKEIEKAKVEMREYKTFVDGLEKDGLINKKDGYTIKHTNGELIINGKTQPAGVYSKYRSFLEKHKRLFIEKSDDDFNIDLD